MTNSSPRPLALVITGLEPGGAERALTQLALRIDREKFQPAVFVLRSRPMGSQAELVKQLEAADISVEFLNAKYKWQFPAAVWQLSRRFRALKPAIVQSFLFHANVVAAAAAKLSGVPVVAGVRVAEPLRNRQRVERWISPLVKRFVCVSHSVAHFCERTCRMPREKLVIIPNGVDLAKFRDAMPADRAALGLPADRRLMICIGRLDHQKGHDWLLPLLPKIFQERPEYDLVLVGDGPLRQHLQAHAVQLGIASRVYFVGWRPQVPQLLKLADLLLLPSRWEGMPNVLLEAMAAGLPVVATQVEGTAEILGPLAADQLVPPNEAAAFTRQVLALTATNSPRLALGRANQQRASEHFSLAVMATAYEELYCQLMNS